MKIIWKRMAALVLVSVLFVSSFQFGSVKAEAAGTIDTVAINLSMPPVDCGEVGALKVTSRSKGCYIDSFVWKDVYGQPIEKFTNNNATIEISLVASPGYVFSGELTATIDGEPVGYDNFGTQLIISKTFSPIIWTPSVSKHPADEEVEVGEIVSFVSYGSFTNESKWLMIAPDGTVFDAGDLPDRVPGVSVSVSYDKLNIMPAKKELNGYKARCEFKGPGGEVVSKAANIVVVDKIEEKAEINEEEGHEHRFSEEITQDAGYHWYPCECGAMKNREEHKYIFTQIVPAIPNENGMVLGVCSVCGYELECITQLSKEETEKIAGDKAADRTDTEGTESAAVSAPETK